MFVGLARGRRVAAGWLPGLGWVLGWEVLGYEKWPGGADLVLALPMHPYLSPDVQDRIIDGVRGFNG